MSWRWAILPGSTTWSRHWRAGIEVTLRLFFYGTLGEGMDNPVITPMRPKLGPPQAAFVHGVLYALPDRDGWYPGLLADARGAPVRGVLYQPGETFTAADLAALDSYEAFDPQDEGASEYVRRLVDVTTASGEEVTAHAYLYNRPLPQGARRIEQDSFAGFLAAGGLRALAPRDP
ncbi:MAG: gamma-glutamylcyclotransferase family protein [Novosphingobium sp.]